MNTCQLCKAKVDRWAPGYLEYRYHAGPKPTACSVQCAVEFKLKAIKDEKERLKGLKQQVDRIS